MYTESRRPRRCLLVDRRHRRRHRRCCRRLQTGR